MRTLESELARLRARDAAHEVEAQAYKQTIHHLKQLLSNHNIPLPSDLISDPHTTCPQATVEVVGLPDSSQTIRAQMPEGNLDVSTSNLLSLSALPLGCPTSPVQVLPGMSFSDGPTGNQVSSAASSTALPALTPHPEGLGTTQVGVDFVLALEHVCLSHHTLHSCSAEGSGHTLMLTSPIMSRAPPSAQSSPSLSGSGLLDGTKWNVPAIELEKLIKLSDRLNLTGELTPVEAWHRIRRHPSFPNMTRDSLGALKAALMPGVQCHG